MRKFVVEEVQYEEDESDGTGRREGGARNAANGVSRAIRNAPEISAETRERVLKVAAELNYVKNDSASSLRCGNSKLIVIIYDHLVNIYFSIMIDYLQTYFRERDYSILMMSVTKHRLNRSDYEFAMSHNIAGIVSFLEPDEEVAGILDSFVVPVLLFGQADGRSGNRLCPCGRRRRGTPGSETLSEKRL